MRRNSGIIGKLQKIRNDDAPGVHDTFDQYNSNKLEIWPITAYPTQGTITPSTTSTTEGQIVTFTVSVNNKFTGTMYYSISNTSMTDIDFAPASINGSFSLTDGSGADADIPFTPEYHRQGLHGRFPAQEMAYTLLALPDPPTAIFAYSDTQAVGVLEAAREMGMKVPEQLSVVGFDNIEAAEYLQITTVRQALYESGVRGCKLLLDIMEAPLQTPVEISLPTELILRETTAPFTIINSAGSLHLKK